MQDNSSPGWDPEDKPASLKAYADFLHREAVRVFTEDKTHMQILFLFKDTGLVSLEPVPENTAPEQLLAGVRNAVQEHDLYGVITISEAWTYMPRRSRDHVAVQIMHGEMRVADLKDEDRTEALMMRMESREGACLTWIDPIIRSVADVTLGEGMVLGREKCLKMERFFG